MPNLILRPPNPSDRESFLGGLQELQSKSEQCAWVYLGDAADLSLPERDFEKYVATLLNRETSAPAGFVTDTVYWAQVNQEIVGRISLRHELNEFLKKVGGHIGYIVRPKWRGQGMATEMLRQVLQTERARAMRKILLTCDESNLASEKTILKNGGVFEGTTDMGPERPRKKRFWISTGGPSLAWPSKNAK